MELHPELARLLDEGAANLAHTESFGTLTAAQFNWQIEAGRWSIGECLSHLNVIAAGDITAIRAAIDDAQRCGITGQGPYRYGWLSRWFIRSMEPPVRTRLKAPKFYLPPPASDPLETLERYRRNAGELAELIRASNGLDLAKVKTPLIQPK